MVHVTGCGADPAWPPRDCRAEIDKRTRSTVRNAVATQTQMTPRASASVLTSGLSVPDPRKRAARVAPKVFARACPRTCIWQVSVALEDETVATVENEASRADWMGDLCGGSDFDLAAGRRWCSGATGCAGRGYWAGNGGAGGCVGGATEVPASGRAEELRCRSGARAVANNVHCGAAGFFPLGEEYESPPRTGQVERVADWSAHRGAAVFVMLVTVPGGERRATSTLKKIPQT